MLWLTERVTRHAIPVTMPCGYSASEVLAGLVVACEQMPSHMLRSITFDRGSEWAEWETLAVTYGIDVWFCDPHSSRRHLARPMLMTWPLVIRQVLP